MRAPNKVLHTKEDTTHFLLFDGVTIQTDVKLLTLRWRPMDHKRRQLEHLKHRASKKNETSQRGEATCLIGYDTYFILVPMSAKTSLRRTERQDVTYVRAAPRGRLLQLPLFLHKGLVLSPARLKLAPLGPTLLQQPIKSLLKSYKGATSSPRTTIAGQKQLKHCPKTERAATVDRTQLTKSSRNPRASRRSSFCR